MPGGEAANRRRREARALKRLGLPSVTIPVRSPAVTRPRLRMVPQIGMTVLIDSSPRCEGTVLQVDCYRETAVVYSEMYGLFTVWWREVLREVVATGH